ncbi:unnamed protein product [Arctogadus glacialis]
MTQPTTMWEITSKPVGPFPPDQEISDGTNRTPDTRPTVAVWPRFIRWFKVPLGEMDHVTQQARSAPQSRQLINVSWYSTTDNIEPPIYDMKP